MIQHHVKKMFLIVASALFAVAAHADNHATDVAAIEAAVAHQARTPANIERDQYRNPAETLNFFGITPEMTVVEIWPGSGWYSEILAPLTRKQGKLIAAHFPVNSDSNYRKNSLEKYRNKLAEQPEVYGSTELAEFDPKNGLFTVADGSADAVLTFRSIHSVMRDDAEQQAFELFFKALKPNGVLGVVTHRGNWDATRKSMTDTAYVSERFVIETALNAGFVLDGISEINANPKDDRDHPNGVWTLLPTLHLGDQDRAMWEAIGESDRMTLRFRKPN